jgi:hypothetical protein
VSLPGKSGDFASIAGPIAAESEHDHPSKSANRVGLVAHGNHLRSSIAKARRLPFSTPAIEVALLSELPPGHAEALN